MRELATDFVSFPTTHTMCTQGCGLASVGVCAYRHDVQARASPTRARTHARAQSHMHTQDVIVMSTRRDTKKFVLMEQCDSVSLLIHDFPQVLQSNTFSYDRTHFLTVGCLPSVSLLTPTHTHAHTHPHAPTLPTTQPHTLRHTHVYAPACELHAKCRQNACELHVNFM